MASNVIDEKLMNVALGLARRGLGNVAPNPAVGCLLVKGSKIVGRGWTQPGGRPHAETMALSMAGADAKGATAYVTLEPCAHQGQTGACADALVEAGVSRCVIAIEDPYPKVSGEGIAILRRNGISVDLGVCQAAAYEVNRGFLSKIENARPTFTLKIASTLDGRIALENGQSKWITSQAARHFGHMLRAQNDGILVGINTVLADDPSLDCRLAGLETQSPIPIILDSELRISGAYQVVAEAQNRHTIVFHCSTDEEKKAELSSLGVRLIKVPSTKDVSRVSQEIAKAGLTRILVEGGGKVHASFLKADMADRIEHFLAGSVIGSGGIPAIGPIGLASLGDAPHFKLEAIRHLGPDMLASYVNAE